MFTASHIITELGGAAKIAARLHIPLTTVASWGASNFIPSWRQGDLLKMAMEKGVKLGTADFPTKEHRISRKTAA
jgi:hypothetical protein